MSKFLEVSTDDESYRVINIDHITSISKDTQTNMSAIKVNVGNQSIIYYSTESYESIVQRLKLVDK